MEVIVFVFAAVGCCKLSEACAAVKYCLVCELSACLQRFEFLIFLRDSRYLLIRQTFLYASFLTVMIFLQLSNKPSLLLVLTEQ